MTAQTIDDRHVRLAKPNKRVNSAKPRAGKKVRSQRSYVEEACAASTDLKSLLNAHSADSEIQLTYSPLTSATARSAFVNEVSRRLVRMGEITGLALTVAIGIQEASANGGTVMFGSVDPLAKLMTKGRQCALTYKFPICVPAPADPDGYRIAIGIAVLDVSFDPDPVPPPAIAALQRGRTMARDLEVPTFEWVREPSREVVLERLNQLVTMNEAVRKQIVISARKVPLAGWAGGAQRRALTDYLIRLLTPLSTGMKGEGLGKGIVREALREAEAPAKAAKRSPNRRSREEVAHVLAVELRAVGGLNPPLVLK